jgi:hypothetical protein
MQKQQTRTFAAPLKGDPKPDHIHILHASSQPLTWPPVRIRLHAMDHRQFDGVLPADRILAGDASDDYTHDETLGATPVIPMAVLLRETVSEVATPPSRSRRRRSTERW